MLFLNDQPLINKSLIDRFERLDSVVVNIPYIFLCPTYPDGQDLFEKVRSLGLEGIVSKKIDKLYTLDSRSTGVFLRSKTINTQLSI